VHSSYIRSHSRLRDLPDSHPEFISCILMNAMSGPFLDSTEQSCIHPARSLDRCRAGTPPPPVAPAMLRSHERDRVAIESRRFIILLEHFHNASNGDISMVQPGSTLVLCHNIGRPLAYRRGRRPRSSNARVRIGQTTPVFQVTPPS
jgi:hypothetical protein